MNKRKILVLTMALSMVAILAAGATLAYFTDTDGAVNVMTAGRVSIVQNEQQRVMGETEYTNELEDFDDAEPKKLIPYTSATHTSDTVTIGDYEVVLSDKYTGYVDKIVSVTNDGNIPAYVRTLVALPTGGEAFEDVPGAAAANWLHWNYHTNALNYWTLNNNSSSEYANVPCIEIGGKGYYVWEFVHKEPVAAGKTTHPSIVGMFFDKNVNQNETQNCYEINGHRIEDVTLGENVNVYVLSQAVQAEGFGNAQDALDEVFGAVTKDNAEKLVEWFENLR